MPSLSPFASTQENIDHDCPNNVQHGFAYSFPIPQLATQPEPTSPQPHLLTSHRTEVRDSQTTSYDSSLGQVHDRSDTRACVDPNLNELETREPRHSVIEWATGQRELVSNRSNRYTLHERGVDINGFLPCDAHLFRARRDEQAMETGPETGTTEPATQPFLDPRREGTTSMLNEQDGGDVLCVLLPSSRPAIKSVELIAEVSPQHILQNHFVDDIPEIQHDLPNINTTSTTHDSDNEGTQYELATQNNEELTSSRPSRDIALRMSSKVHNPCLGFVFGRNPKRCDLLLSSDSAMRVSNCHFRIFVNRHGVLMLEDTSTNGTCVDKVLLRSKRGNQGGGSHPSTRTLNAGAIIELPTVARPEEETVRFIVRFPARDQAQEQYNDNLASYLTYIQQAERQLQVAATGKGDMPPPVLMPFNAMKDKAETSPNASILAAATGDYNHGVNWNGGEKYNIVSQIGKGAFAMVYKLSAKKDGEVYACKQIEKRRFIKDGVLNHKVHNEILVMKDLEHPNIVKYIEYYETKVHIFIVMEYVKMGDLSNYTDVGSAMQEYMCQIMAIQIIQALDYLHERKITHRDIKPDNILVASHTPYVFKLSDFGLSKIVNNEETFLKSFCGTLLYCAPEVYPGFQRVKLGYHPFKRTRSSEPRKGTQPYEHSVDMWSISAVLFHLLCGHPPYTGSMEDEGASMLVNIMNAPPNWERLEQAGISAEGIDFVKRTLVIEPSLRAREAELLVHPWINPGGPSLAEMGLNTEADVADDLDASQLSLAENATTQGFENDIDDLVDPRATKRSKHFQSTELEPEIDLFRSIRQENVWGGTHNDQRTQDLLLGTSNQQRFGIARPPQGDRLFGEIGSSALRSSGVLGQDVHVALQVPSNGSYDPFSNGSSDMGLEMASAEDVSYTGSNLNGEHFSTSETSAQQYLQYPQLLPWPAHPEPAPSLLGAEAMVGQMNMASPHSGVSGTSEDSKPASPKTPASRDASPGIQAGEHSAQPSKSSATIAPQMPIIGESAEQELLGSFHSAQSAVKCHTPDSGQSSDQDATTKPYSTLNTVTRLQGSRNTSGVAERTSPGEGQHYHNADNSDISLLPTAFNSQTSEQHAPDSNNSDNTAPSPQISSSQTVTALTATIGPNPNMIPTNSPAQTDSFAKPPLRFGNLVPTPGSIPSVPIKITAQATTFGRHPSSDFVHPNVREDRIPKHALDITMWYPNIERDVASGKREWHLNESLTALISTRTSRYIKVNDVRLMKGSGCWLYGKLKTGDVITVFGPPECVDPAGMDAKQKEYLQFRCEFFVGGSKEPRESDEPFLVEKEKDKYKQNEARRSRESSAAKSHEGDEVIVNVSARSGALDKTRSNGMAV